MAMITVLRHYWVRISIVNRYSANGGKMADLGTEKENRDPCIENEADQEVNIGTC